MNIMVKKALLFCENNDGILELAQFLGKAGWLIFSNGKTAEILKQNKIEFKIESALDEGPRNIPDSSNLMEKILETKIGSDDYPFENPDEENNYFLVCVNFDPLSSPFESIPKVGVGTSSLNSFRSSLIRNSCTNFSNVLVLTDPADYKEALIEIRTDSIQQLFRMYLAGKAFNLVSAYDAANACAILKSNPFSKETSLNYLTLPYKKVMDLHCGKNSQSISTLYSLDSDDGTFSGFKKLQGREMTHRIITDVSFAWDQISSLYENLKTLSAVKSENCDGYPYTTQFTPLTGTVYTLLVKYGLVVGAALDTNAKDSFMKTISYDADSTAHSTIACSSVIDGDAAREMAKYDFSAVLAPSYTEEARDILATNQGIRLIVATKPQVNDFNGSFLGNNILIESTYKKLFEKWIVPTKTRPNQKLCDEMAFGMCIAKISHSYAALCVKDNSVVGLGAGHSSREKALDNVLYEAKQTFSMHPTKDNIIADVLVCDSSIELCNSIKELIDRGVKAIIQTGGHPNDKELIEYCDEHNIALIFTGITHYNY